MARDLGEFVRWECAVELALQDIAEIGREDIADMPWLDWFRAGMTPREAARLALEKEGCPDD